MQAEQLASQAHWQRRYWHRPRPSPPIPTRFSCDRACLAKHADARLPLARDVKYTETGIVKPLGQGLWKTAKACRATA